MLPHYLRFSRALALVSGIAAVEGCSASILVVGPTRDDGSISNADASADAGQDAGRDAGIDATIADAGDAAIVDAGSDGAIADAGGDPNDCTMCMCWSGINIENPGNDGPPCVALCGCLIEGPLFPPDLPV